MDVMNNLEQNSAELRSINQKQEKRVQYYETSALHQTIFYLIFQLIILLSVSQSSSSITCQTWWLPFSLSLICSFMFFVAHLNTIIMYLDAQFQYDLNILQLESMRSQSFKTHDVLKYDKFRMYKRHVRVYSSVLLLSVFTAIVLFACHSIPCDGRN